MEKREEKEEIQIWETLDIGLLKSNKCRTVISEKIATKNW